VTDKWKVGERRLLAESSSSTGHFKADLRRLAHPAWPSARWETIMGTAGNVIHREPWNKGKLVEVDDALEISEQTEI